MDEFNYDLYEYITTIRSHSNAQIIYTIHWCFYNDDNFRHHLLWWTLFIKNGSQSAAFHPDQFIELLESKNITKQSFLDEPPLLLRSKMGKMMTTTAIKIAKAYFESIQSKVKYIFFYITLLDNNYQMILNRIKWNYYNLYLILEISRMMRE